jgi:arginase
MAEAASLLLPYPEAAVVAENSLGEQSLALALSLPERPLVLGGCCCSHVGAIEGLAARFERLAVVWFDAHGDLNTPESSPSGNLWGMPLRMVLDAGGVRVDDTVLIGARDLDPPEEAFIAESGLPAGAEAMASALDGTDAVYVAFDADVLDPDELPSFMPVPDGMTLDEAESALRSIAERSTVAGAGLSGLTPATAVEKVSRLVAALGL